MNRDFYNGLGEIETDCSFTGAVPAGSIVHCNVYLSGSADLETNISGEIGLTLQSEDVAGCLLDNGVFSAVDVIQGETDSAYKLTIRGTTAQRFADKESIGDAITQCLSTYTTVLRDPVCVDEVTQVVTLNPMVTPVPTRPATTPTVQATPETPKANLLLLAGLVVGLIYLSENEKKR